MELGNPQTENNTTPITPLEDDIDLDLFTAPKTNEKEIEAQSKALFQQLEQ